METKQIIREANNKPGLALTRAVYARVLDSLEVRAGVRYFERPGADEVAAEVYRAAINPGTTGTSGWASQLAQTAVASFVTSLGPLSGASQLFAAALNVPFPPGAAAVNVPAVIPAAIAGGFVEENEPIPVASWTYTDDQLKHKKMAILSVISRELAKSGRGQSEVDRLLRESAALTLDGNLFTDAAATSAAPAGLFYGLTAITPGAFDADPLINDLTSLVATVAPVGGDVLAFVTSPARAAQISIRAPQLRYPVIASSAIADTRIAAVALNGLAITIDPEPDIEVSGDAVIHMSTVPLELVSDAPSTADPLRSLFQTASFSIRLLLDVDWKLRDAGAVAIRDEVAW